MRREQTLQAEKSGGIDETTVEAQQPHEPGLFHLATLDKALSPVDQPD
jgi:hypothetical protein